MAACPRHIPPPPFRLASLPNRKQHALPNLTAITKKRGFDRPNGTSDSQELEITNLGSFCQNNAKYSFYFCNYLLIIFQ